MPAQDGIHDFIKKARVFFFLKKKEAKKTLSWGGWHRESHARPAHLYG